MKSIVRKLITVSLALLLCLLPMAAQAQSMLGERLTMAFEAGRTIEVIVGLDLDDSLAMFGFMPPEDFSAIQELLRATTLKFTATQATSDRLEIGFELRMQEASLVTENQTTPYRWVYVFSDDTMMECVYDQYTPDDHPTGITGVGGKHRFRFEATASGTCLIDLYLVRMGDDVEVAVEKVTYAVIIEE